jgi:MFS family permease
MCAGSLGVSLSRAVPELMVWRFLQAFGSAAGLSVGSGVIGDIYRLEERYLVPFDRLYLVSNRCLRGTAMGVFFAVGTYYLMFY